MSRSDRVTAHLGLGSNLGDRLVTLESAIWSLDESDGIAVTDVSGIYETDAWGPIEQDAYLNAVVEVATTLSPRELLVEVQAIEQAFGRDRDREERWGPRPLDIDILLYGDEVVDEPDLVIPHPRIGERAFVLVPLMEVMPGGTLPDGTRLTRLVSALAPITGIDLHVRMEDPPGRTRMKRPEGPRGPAARLAGDWTPPRGAPPGTER